MGSAGQRVRFRDRHHAGRELASALAPGHAGRDDVIVLALPRGGVPVAYEVATVLGAPLDVFVVRKLGVPGHEEFAMGAIAPGGVLVLDEGAVRALGISREQIERVVAVPVASARTCDEFRDEVDEIVCLVTPEPFHAVGMWYDDFSPTTDEEVRDLLMRASRAVRASR